MMRDEALLWFSTQDHEGLTAFWRIYDAHYEEVNQATQAIALQEPAFVQMRQTMSEEALAQNNEQRREQLQHTIIGGKWAEYELYLRVQASVYDKLGLSFAVWHALVHVSIKVLTPHLVQEHAGNPTLLSRALLAMQAFFDRAVVILAEAYQEAREAELRQSKQHIETTLHSIGDAVIVTDVEGRIIRMNPTAEQLTGWPIAEALQRPLEEVFQSIKEESRESVTNPVQRVLQEGVIVGLANHMLLLHRDGTERAIADSAAPIRHPNGEIDGVVLVFRDTTEQRRLEQARQREAELKAENRQIQQASRLKSEFLANMSHELRTPLNAIIGFAELLHDGVVTAEMPEYQEFLTDILASGQHLLQLINDVLDLSKVEAGKIDFFPEPLDLNAVCSEVLNILKTVAAKNQLQVSLEVDATLQDVYLDPARLKQVLYNYVSNALKFTPAGGRITVRIKTMSDAMRLEVEDTGIGIAPEDIDKLFAEFQQLNASSNKTHAGTGLGLVLARRLVEAQGGTVGVQSVLGQGSTFYAILPRHSPVGSPPPKPVGTTSTSTSTHPGAPSILVIEDNDTDRTALIQMLEHTGYDVATASTGAQAIAMCQQRTFQAITLDLLLPDMSGLDVLQEIRTHSANQHVPIIVVTVVTEPGVIAGAVVHDLLPKPPDPTTLLTSLKRAIGNAPRQGPVLIVDDDPASRRLMTAHLTQIGYQALCAPDAHSGLRMSQETTPIAVILDLIMPDFDGFTFLEQFRQQPHCQTIPVLIWSIKDLTQNERKRLAASAQGIYSKGSNGNAALLAQITSFLPIKPQG